MLRLALVLPCLTHVLPRVARVALSAVLRLGGHRCSPQQPRHRNGTRSVETSSGAEQGACRCLVARGVRSSATATAGERRRVGARKGARQQSRPGRFRNTIILVSRRR
jgi:hypothetical protein